MKNISKKRIIIQKNYFTKITKTKFFSFGLFDNIFTYCREIILRKTTVFKFHFIQKKIKKRKFEFFA